VLAKDQAIRKAYEQIKDDNELSKNFNVDSIFNGNQV